MTESNSVLLKLKITFFNNSIIIFLPPKGEILMQLFYEFPQKLPTQGFLDVSQDCQEAA